MEDKMNKSLYHYKAYVTKVYDGDTVTVDIDLGLNVFAKKEKIRLSRINAPELRGEEREEGLKSRDFLRSLIFKKEILVQTIKDRKGKYGRYLGEIFLVDEAGQKTNINDLLVEKGFAVYKKY